MDRLINTDEYIIIRKPCGTGDYFQRHSDLEFLVTMFLTELNKCMDVSEFEESYGMLYGSLDALERDRMKWIEDNLEKGQISYDRDRETGEYNIKYHRGEDD